MVHTGSSFGSGKHRAEEGSSGPVMSPMPGKIVSVSVGEGERVIAGQPLVTVEAMKMEHTVSAPTDGVVTSLRAAVGMQVAMDQELLSVVAEESE